MSDKISGLNIVPGNIGEIKTEVPADKEVQLKNSNLGHEIKESTSLKHFENQKIDPAKVKGQALTDTAERKGLSIAFKIFAAVGVLAGIALGAAAIIATCGVAGIVGAAAATVTGLLGTTGTAVAAATSALVGIGSMAVAKNLAPEHPEEFVNEARVNDDTKTKTDNKNIIKNDADEDDEISIKNDNEIVILDDADKEDGYTAYACFGKEYRHIPGHLIEDMSGGNFKAPKGIKSEGFKGILDSIEKKDDKWSIDGEKFHKSVATFVDEILKSVGVDVNEKNPAMLAALVQTGINNYLSAHEPAGGEDNAFNSGDAFLSDEGRFALLSILDVLIRSNQKRIDGDQDIIKDPIKHTNAEEVNKLNSEITDIKKDNKFLSIFKDAIKLKVSELRDKYNKEEQERRNLAELDGRADRLLDPDDELE